MKHYMTETGLDNGDHFRSSTNSGGTSPATTKIHYLTMELVEGETLFAAP